MELRGRVMGFVQMAFASSQVLGIPLGLYLANRWGWHSPFLMIVGASILVGILIIVYMKPINDHLKHKRTQNAFQHLLTTLSHTSYLKGFAATTLLATGGFMLMPFASAFSVNNLKIDQNQLPLLYMITGIFSMAAGPLIGKFSDSIGKYKVFVMGSVLSMLVVLVYCNLGETPFWVVTTVSIVMFVGVSSRMISSQALMTAVPSPADRGAFMSINSSVQQISGGIATFIAGLIVIQTPGGELGRYDVLGYVVVGAMFVTILMMYIIHKHITQKSIEKPAGV